MKTRSLIVCLLAVLTMIGGTLGASAATQAAVTVTVDGKAIAFREKPVVRDGRLLVPFRAFGEAVGATVSFDGKAKLVTLKKNGSVYRLTLGSRTAQVNGKAVTLDVPPLVVNGTTMVPLRFIAENFGMSVSYNAARGRVAISSKAEAAKTHDVEIKEFAFTPAKLTIKAGDSVTFTNRDAMAHTATADDGSFDTGKIAKDKSVTVTFKTKGTFTYYCDPHPFMKGTIVVE